MTVNTDVETRPCVPGKISRRRNCTWKMFGFIIIITANSKRLRITKDEEKNASCEYYTNSCERKRSRNNDETRNLSCHPALKTLRGFQHTFIED